MRLYLVAILKNMDCKNQENIVQKNSIFINHYLD